MKKFKRFAAVLCTALIALTLTACGGGKSKDVTVDTAKLADELLTTVTSDELSKMSVDPSTVYLYQSDDVTSAIAYASSGATACEVAVIESKNAANAESMEKLLQDRVDSQKALYASYDAASAGKLDDAIIKSAGKYINISTRYAMNNPRDIWYNIDTERENAPRNESFGTQSLRKISYERYV